MVKHQDFVYPVPEEIESKYVGPLQCAGVGVPLKYHFGVVLLPRSPAGVVIKTWLMNRFR